MKRKIAVFDPDEGFFALHSSGYGGIKRQDRTLRKQPVAVFSEGARWRTGTKRAFCSQLEKSKRVHDLDKAKNSCIALATELFFNEGQVKKNKTWGGKSRVDTTLGNNPRFIVISTVLTMDIFAARAKCGILDPYR